MVLAFLFSRIFWVSPTTSSGPSVFLSFSIFLWTSPLVLCSLPFLVSHCLTSSLMHYLFLQPGQKLFCSIISHNSPSLSPSLCGLTSPLASPQQCSLILATSLVEGQRQEHAPEGTCRLASYIKVYLHCSHQQTTSVHLNLLSVAMCPAHTPLGNQHS